MIRRLHPINHALPGDVIVARLGPDTTLAFVCSVSADHVVAETNDAVTWLIPQDCVVRIVSSAPATRSMG